MDDIEALRRQHAELSRLRAHLFQSLDRLQSDYEEEIAVQSGEKVRSVREIPGFVPLCYGLEWSARDEPGFVIYNAGRLVKLMERVQVEIGERPALTYLSTVPQQDWDKYMALLDEYRKLHAATIAASRKAEAFWKGNVLPYLEADGDGAADPTPDSGR